MSERETVVVLGLGEVGKPLLELVSEHHHAVGVDVAPPAGPIGDVDVMHVCYPFEIHDFVGETARYVERFSPRLTVINSTVAVGTTRAVAERSGATVVYSPVRGKHVRMRDEMLKYAKFVGGLDAESAECAAAHFQSIGMQTRVLASPEAAELAKLSETTYFGVLIAWAQEVERHCDRFGVDYDQVVSFYDEVGFFPAVKYFPGIIGGHCVMQNIEILRRDGHSDFLEAIRASNRAKIEREARRSSSAGGRSRGA
jgi:UDP-N-acetyl-D-mannosaminuronate dehydrogenase